MAQKAKTSAIVFPAKTSNKAVLDRCAKEWKTRNVNEDGSLKANRWAPIYVKVGDTEMSVRLISGNLVLYGPVASTPAPKPRIVWED